MKKTMLSLVALVIAMISMTACSDTQTYAELLKQEEEAILDFVRNQGIDPIQISDEQLEQYIDGELTFELNKWYRTQDDFYIKVKDFGDLNKKFSDQNSPNIVVRYDSCYSLIDFKSFTETPSTNNQGPYEEWLLSPWSFNENPEYGSVYGWAIDFPGTFLGENGVVSMIVPSKLNNQEIQAAVYPFYYGEVSYAPNYQ